MKRYNFSVKVEGVDDVQSTLIDSFINEVKQDGKEQLVTETINIETSKVHKKILFDFSTAINLQLEKIGLEGFQPSGITGTPKNMYTRSAIECDVDIYVDTDVSYRITIKGNEDRGFKDSKYTTYTGDYYLEITGRNTLRSEGMKIASVDDALEYMKDTLMKYIKNQ
jgi:hypothetical protein